MVSQSAEYSLRAVLCLAAQPRGQALTTQQIAERACIPAGYLAKMLQVLGRAGIVASQRGLNGGFSLALPAEKLTLLDIVRAVECSRRITSCPAGNPDHAVHLCPLHRRLDAAAATVEEILKNTTIAQVMAESNLLNPLNTCTQLHCPPEKTPAQKLSDVVEVPAGFLD
ncbi:MAG TPA: Rrf2 family transcriptional regulator [Tepidisphaeraceae bacterium]|nr:Rrf2 family transcriptional regulator [Tepidisphaeraceae bacterium]